MLYDNEMNLIISSDSKNQSFARSVIAIFISQLDPTLSELTDIKTAVSEAVTNAIIHGYNNILENNKIYINCGYIGNEVYIEIKDKGIGIKNIEEAMTPLYTSKKDMERSGMGFTVMETFMDNVEVFSKENEGTIIKMTKKLSRS